MSEAWWRPVTMKLWTDPRWLALPPARSHADRLLYFYLTTGPRTSRLPGLLVAGPLIIIEDLGRSVWTQRLVHHALDDLAAVGLVRFDPETRLIWCVDAYESSLPSNTNICKHWAHQMRELPDCELWYEAHRAIYTSLLDAKGESFAEAFAKPLRERFIEPSRTRFAKGSPNTKSETKREDEKREQEGEHERESANGHNPDRWVNVHTGEVIDSFNTTARDRVHVNGEWATGTSVEARAPEELDRGYEEPHPLDPGVDSDGVEVWAPPREEPDDPDLLGEHGDGEEWRS